MTAYIDELPADVAHNLHAKLAFLSKAIGAIAFGSEGESGDPLAWEGLLYITYDLLNMTSVLKEESAQH